MAQEHGSNYKRGCWRVARPFGFLSSALCLPLATAGFVLADEDRVYENLDVNRSSDCSRIIAPTRQSESQSEGGEGASIVATETGAASAPP